MAAKNASGFLKTLLLTFLTRPTGLAGAVLQTVLQVTHSLTHSLMAFLQNCCNVSLEIISVQLMATCDM